MSTFPDSENASQGNNFAGDARSVDYPNACVHQLFQMQAARTPDACAVVIDDKFVSYSELNLHSNQLAWKLIELNIGVEEPVGICAERSIEAIIAILAVLKVGGSCLPLDPDYPKDRLAFMLKDGGVRFVLLHERFGGRMPETAARTLGLDTLLKAPGSTQNPQIAVLPDNLAYIIYTSGTTGKPKGVEVPHRGIVRLLMGVDYVKLDETTALLQLSSLTFDGSIFDIWGALLHGGRSVLYPGRIPSIGLLRDLLRKHKVTTAFLTTSVFNAIVDEDPVALASLEQILVGGEKLSVSHIRRAWDHLPSVQIINAYGPTEATVFACSYRIAEKPQPSETSIPIGIPISNTRAYILDENMTPVSVGVAGELHLGGPGIARGYHNRPDLTAERFVPDPFGRDSCLYKTGDLARWRSDGNIDFLGRIDTQVKLRGFRIELSEIEEMARGHKDVLDAVVVVSTRPNQEQFLSLFVVRKPDQQLSPDDVLRFLTGVLPEFMVPACCSVLDQWPLTSSGKIDRLALSTLDNHRSRAMQPGIARTALEKKLVQIWEDLLDVRPVGIHENFMNIGGDSLLAVRLFAKIEHTLGTRLPEVALWEAPTIEKLAALISEKGSIQKLAYATPIQPCGEKTPFFCVGAGRLLWPLATALGPTQPFFSIGIEPAACYVLRPPYRLEELASYLVSAILEKYPRGPYYLGGFCYDGLYAYEVARQLIQQGYEIGLLALFETTNPSPSTNARVRFELGCKRMLIRLQYRAHQLYDVKFRDLAIDLRMFFQRQWWGTLPFLYSLKIASASNTLTPILYIAGSTYKPQPISCPTVLFRGNEWQIASAGDPYLGWRDLLKGKCKTFEVPGNHRGIFSEFNVTELAQKLQFALSGMQANTHWADNTNRED